MRHVGWDIIQAVYDNTITSTAFLRIKSTNFISHLGVIWEAKLCFLSSNDTNGWSFTSSGLNRSFIRLTYVIYEVFIILQQQKKLWKSLSVSKFMKVYTIPDEEVVLVISLIFTFSLRSVWKNPMPNSKNQ